MTNFMAGFMHRTAWPTFLVAIAFVASACGSSDSSSEELTAIGNSIEQVGRSGLDDADDDVQFGPELLACVNEAGIDMAEVLGYGSEERIRLWQAFIDCSPAPTEDPAIIVMFAAGLEAAFDHQIELSFPEGSCLLRYILDNSDDPARALVVGDSEADLEIRVAGVEECLSIENRAVFYGESGPNAYGDSPRLDLLFDGCEQGDMRLCDILYFRSAVGSEYEDLAYNCGGAEAATETSCSLDGKIDPITGSASPNSPSLELLSRECGDSDLTACDLLFLVAPLGSEYVDIGRTCAGRVSIGALPDCRTSLGD